ncbi:MAG: ABC transporter substrate-binding protein [bacterium]|nr:ABC transporter substrate-binding protein [bacterium]
MRRVTCLLLVAVLVGSLFGASGCRKQAVGPPTIKIGIAGPMAFIQGEHHWAGATMAMEEINAAGGVQVGGEKWLIELVKIDTNEILSPEDAATAVERAITVDKVDFLIGGFRTEGVFPMTEVAMDHQKIFMIAGAATNELLVGRVDTNYDRYKYLFRVTPIRSTDLAKICFEMLGYTGAILRQVLGAQRLRVAILAEQLQWNEALIAGAQQMLPALLGMDVVGVWRPSATATDVTAELTAIKAAGAHIIFQINSGPVGITCARQWGELEIPAVMQGINVEAQKLGFWQATRGYGNYETTLNTYGRVSINETTMPFYNAFVERFGEAPAYTAGAHQAIEILVAAIERAGTLDSDAVVAELEKTDVIGPTGRLVFDALHDVTWGPAHVTGIVTQWQDGEMVVVWPFPGWQGLNYEGIKPYAIPPRVIQYWMSR